MLVGDFVVHSRSPHGRPRTFSNLSDVYHVDGFGRGERGGTLGEILVWTRLRF